MILSNFTYAAARRGLTLIELLIVVLIIGILATIGMVNFHHMSERALKSADAANLHTLATALQAYHIDFGDFPPGDREAGPFESHTPRFTAVGNGPAAGGSWDGVPWILHSRGYLSDWRALFTPKYLRRYKGGATLRGDWPRFHNFRYAYNSAGLASGGHAGGTGPGVMSGETWILRNLWLDPRSGWHGSAYPGYPADYRFPYGSGEWEGRLEHVVYADLAVRTVIGGEDRAVDAAAAEYE